MPVSGQTAAADEEDEDGDDDDSHSTLPTFSNEAHSYVSYSICGLRCSPVLLHMLTLNNVLQSLNEEANWLYWLRRSLAVLMEVLGLALYSQRLN